MAERHTRKSDKPAQHHIGAPAKINLFSRQPIVLALTSALDWLCSLGEISSLRLGLSTGSGGGGGGDGSGQNLANINLYANSRAFLFSRFSGCKFCLPLLAQFVVAVVATTPTIGVSGFAWANKAQRTARNNDESSSATIQKSNLPSSARHERESFFSPQQSESAHRLD